MMIFKNLRNSSSRRLKPPLRKIIIDQRVGRFLSETLIIVNEVGKNFSREGIKVFRERWGFNDSFLQWGIGLSIVERTISSKRSDRVWLIERLSENLIFKVKDENVHGFPVLVQMRKREIFKTLAVSKMVNILFHFWSLNA